MKRYVTAASIFAVMLYSSVSGLFAQSTVTGKLSVHYSEALPVATDHGSRHNRRDPSDIIKVGDTWHIWYSRMNPQESSGYDASVWHATSTDQGKTWTEQGEAIPRGKGSDWDATSCFTPNILYFDKKYHLFYTGAGPKFNRRSSPVHIGMVSSDSPYGPWVKCEGNPILKPSEDVSKFDSFRIDDACLAVREEKIWLYYKGRQTGKAPGTTKMGLAVSDSPSGPFVRQNDGNPVQPGGHEVLIWMDEKEGIYSMVNHNGPKNLINTIQYAEDGMNFTKVADAEAYFEGEKTLIKASGFFRSEITATATGDAPSWGIAGTRFLQYIDVRVSKIGD